VAEDTGIGSEYRPSYLVRLDASGKVVGDYQEGLPSRVCSVVLALLGEHKAGVPVVTR